MTWEDLYKLVCDMKRTNHTSFEKVVSVIVEGSIYEVDVIESLTTGDAYLMPAIATTEEEVDG